MTIDTSLTRLTKQIIRAITDYLELRGIRMTTKLIKDIEDIFDRKMTPEFAKVNERFDAIETDIRDMKTDITDVKTDIKNVKTDTSKIDDIQSDLKTIKEKLSK